jgi:hypothetical protein
MALIPTDAAARPAATLGSGLRCLRTRRCGPASPLLRARSPAAEAPSSPVTASESAGLAPERSTGGAASSPSIATSTVRQSARVVSPPSG